MPWRPSPWQPVPLGWAGRRKAGWLLCPLPRAGKAPSPFRCFSIPRLKDLFYRSSNLQYFKRLIQIPQLPEVSVPGHTLGASESRVHSSRLAGLVSDTVWGHLSSSEPTQLPASLCPVRTHQPRGGNPSWGLIPWQWANLGEGWPHGHGCFPAGEDHLGENLDPSRCPQVQGERTGEAFAKPH